MTLVGLNEDYAFPLLLRRPPVIPQADPLPAIQGRRVMVTGAGGSIGSELCLQIASHQPELLIVAEQSEIALYEINCTLDEAGFQRRFPALTDVRSGACMGSLFASMRPDLVFHAAALKHVPLLENDHNLIEAVRTNVQGSVNVATQCARTGADLVLVSTDKAVRPASVMGLTKRAAELAIRTPSVSLGSEVAIVRFGNVLGSSGSVVPLFRRQIAQGGPVTVTHEGMTRYFMTIKQAVDMMLRVAPDGRQPTLIDGQTWLYVLDMGRPVRILDLAREMIHQAGLRPDVDIKIEITGMRPGEKLHEELAYPEEDLAALTWLPGVYGAPVPPASPTVDAAVESLAWAVHDRNLAAVKADLLAIVPDYAGTDVWK